MEAVYPTVPGDIVTALTVTTVLATVVPILAIVVLCAKRVLPAKPTIFGILAFFLSQVVIRGPLLSALGANEWYVTFMQTNYVLYVLLVGGLSAGLFEEGARFIGARLLKQQTMFRDAVAFGIGHAVCEIVMVLGMTEANNLAAAMMLNDGTFAAAAQTMTSEQAMATATAVASITVADLAIALAERLIATAFHVFLTVLVFRGVNKGKPLYLVAAIFAHALFNTVGVLAYQYWGIVASELLMLLLAGNGMLYVIKIRKKFDGEEEISLSDDEKALM